MKESKRNDPLRDQVAYVDKLLSCMRPIES